MRSLPLLRRALVGLAAAATALVVVSAPPAQAATGGSTSSGDVVLYDSCQPHAIDYAIDVPAGSSWQLQLQVVKADGFTFQGQDLAANSEKGSPTSGQFSIQFCGSEPAGTWTIKGTVCLGTSCLLPNLPGVVTLPESTFQVRRAQTGTTLKAKRVRQGYRLTARVVREEPGGFAPSEGVFVRFERLVGDEWKPVVRRQIPTVHGVAKLRRGLPSGTRVRAVVQQANNYSASTSGTVRLRR